MSAMPAANPLRSRDDVARALEALAAPLGARLSPAGARRILGFNAGRHGDDCAGIEAFARPLWGLAPWLAGGGGDAGHAALVRGIACGFDPAHPEYWGEPRHHDQRIAEVAAVAAAILAAPAAFLDPLDARARGNLVAWIARLDAVALPDNNWRWFRVLARLAAERLGGALDPALLAADLDRLEMFDVGGGWYSDGANEQRDHYVAFAMQFYALLYVRLEEGRDPHRCARLRERATRFAHDYAAWFDARGAALPIGRSLTYRFAHAAFWGALAYANVPALPWGEVKGLWLRNLRWWLGLPITDAAGILVPGYAYPNAHICEDYVGPGSSYWAFKSFLPLALPETHPFWAAEEAAPGRGRPIASQAQPRLVVCRADDGAHVYALNAGQWASWRPRHDAAKYAKFCYSTRFGFSVGSGAGGTEAGGYDSTLALSEDGVSFRVRRETSAHEVGERHVASTWLPWPDVEIRTWLVGAPPWHLRVHRIRSRRALATLEGGFAVPCEGVDRLSTAGWRSEARLAAAGGMAGSCDIVDLEGDRNGTVIVAEACSNLMAPRTAIPALTGEVRAGETWLACAVLASFGEAADPVPFRCIATFSGRRVECAGLALDLAR